MAKKEKATKKEVTPKTNPSEPTPKEKVGKKPTPKKEREKKPTLLSVLKKKGTFCTHDPKLSNKENAVALDTVLKTLARKHGLSVYTEGGGIRVNRATFTIRLAQ